MATIVFAVVGFMLGCSDSGETPTASTHLPLAVYSIAPDSGPMNGGNQVAIFGMGFLPGITITFDSVAATHVFILDSRTLTATVPAHSKGVVKVTASGPSGQVGKLTWRYRYWDSVTDCTACWDYDQTSAVRRRP